MAADVTTDNFDAEVLKSKVPVVVDFWAEWCSPCRMFTPILEETSKEYDGKIKFVKLNTDENTTVAQEYGIMSIPTTLLFESGEVKAMSVGAIPKTEFKKWLDSNV